MEVDGLPTSDLSERELEQGTFDEPDGSDDPGEEEDGESDKDEMNEDDALDESDESDEELESGNEEGNLDEDTEEKVSNEEKNVNEDAKEKESGDDKSEEARGKDVKVSTSGVMSVQPSEQKKKQNRHIVFDEKDSNDLPLPEFLESSKLEDGEPEDSDSDAAPEEVTLAVGKKVADREDMNRKKELQKKKHLVKEDRKRKHVRNKLQQEQKRQRLENLNSKRLPKNFLEAVVAEQKEQPGKKAIEKLREEKKIKKFIDSCNIADENVDEEGLTTSQCGVHVRTLKQETKKNIFIAKQARAFIKEAQYGKRLVRMESKELHQMEVRRQKSGKNILAKNL